MRISGRGGSESLMFIAPAAILGGFYIWMSGGPRDLLVWLDRAVIHAAYVGWGWCAALVAAASKL